MIPIRDTEPSRSKPVVIKLLILVNALVFIYEVGLGRRLEPFLYNYGLVPARYFALAGAGWGHYADRFTPMVTHMFMHGGWFHVIFNMLFLWIFGDNIEDRLGRFRFIVFYVVCGLAAAWLQLYINPHSQVPMVGASGAIAGVMGAYMVLFPRARVLTLVPIFYFMQLVELPAAVFLGLWFAMQFFTGAIMALEGAGKSGGVAFWAHIGGFVAGVALVKLFAKRMGKRSAYVGAGGNRDGTASDATFGDESW